MNRRMIPPSLFISTIIVCAMVSLSTGCRSVQPERLGKPAVREMKRVAVFIEDMELVLDGSTPPQYLLRFTAGLSGCQTLSHCEVIGNADIGEIRLTALTPVGAICAAVWNRFYIYLPITGALQLGKRYRVIGTGTGPWKDRNITVPEEADAVTLAESITIPTDEACTTQRPFRGGRRVPLREQ